jgi:plastocyanin
MAEETTNSYGKRPLWQWILLYVVIGIVVYGLIYYFVLAKNGGYNQSSTGIYQQNVSPTASQTQTPSITVQSQKFTIEGKEFAFTPSKLTVKKGEAVEITFKNMGKYPHNLTIADLNVKTKTIQPGEEDTITFTPDKTGSFSFMCTVPTHADKGMTGTLTVE